MAEENQKDPEVHEKSEKAELNDLDLAARQLKLRGGGKSLSAIGFNPNNQALQNMQSGAPHVG